MAKKICQLYLPAFFRSYVRDSIWVIGGLLENINKARFSGVYLIALWEDGEYDNGFDVINYSVKPRFGTDGEFKALVKHAHKLGLTVGVDVVPNHVSDRNILAQNCLNGVPGYEDALYVVSKEEAERLTEAGVPSFFGKLAYSNFGDKYVRSTFADYGQLNANWNNEKVQEYFKEVFQKLKDYYRIDFARIDCGMMLHEDVTKADPANPFACMQPKKSIEAIRKVSGGMPLFFEWFDPATACLLDGMDNCYALDCSYVLSGQINTDWSHEKLLPLFGGHDQMTLADRGFSETTIAKMMKKASKSEYIFSDMQTELGWTTEGEILPGDEEYDASLENPNQRYRARRPIKPVVEAFKAKYPA